MDLATLGPRLCIIGPSNSGKSTLAAAIGRRRDLPVVHLDQLHHRPGSQWQARPREEFVALHHIVRVTPQTRRRNAALFDAVPLPKLLLDGLAAIAAFRAAEGLVRHDLIGDDDGRP